MKIRLACSLAALTILMVACTPSTPSRGNTDLFQATVGSTLITWREFDAPHFSTLADTPYIVTRNDAVQLVLSNGMHVPSGDCMSFLYDGVPNAVALHNECVALLRARSTQNGNLQAFVSLAEQAVRADGRCQWLGYDPAFDRQVRSMGSLAAASDTRLFFTRMRCPG